MLGCVARESSGAGGESSGAGGVAREAPGAGGVAREAPCAGGGETEVTGSHQPPVLGEADVTALVSPQNSLMSVPSVHSLQTSLISMASGQDWSLRDLLL